MHFRRQYRIQREISVRMAGASLKNIRFQKNRFFGPPDPQYTFMLNDSPGNSDQFGTTLTSVRFNAAEL